MMSNNNNRNSTSVLYSNNINSSNEVINYNTTTKLNRKSSRKILERKNGVEYDDDDLNLINCTASNFIADNQTSDISPEQEQFEQQELEMQSEKQKEFYDNQFDDVDGNNMNNYGDDNEKTIEDDDVELLLNRKNNLNSAFDELFAAAQSGDTSATAAVEVKLATAAAANTTFELEQFERKSSTSPTNSSSPTSVGLTRRRSSRNESMKMLNQNSNSNAHLQNSNGHTNGTNTNRTKSNYLSLKEAESYLGSPQQLTRSCSCKRPGSFKKMKSRNSITNSTVNQNQIPVRTGSHHSTSDGNGVANNIQIQNKQNLTTNVNSSTSDELETVKTSNRAGSLPFENLDNKNLDTYRLRCFNTTPKGAIVNRGDSFKRSFKRSNHSIHAAHHNNETNNNNTIHIDNSSKPPLPTTDKQQTILATTLPAPIVLLSQPSDDGSMKVDDSEIYLSRKTKLIGILKNINETNLINESTANADNNIENIDTFVVYVMGSIGVGKTSLTKQFKTSEYRGTYDINFTASIDDLEETVSVMLDGVESRLLFLPIDIESPKPFNNYDTLTSYISTQLVNNNPIYQSLRLTNDAYIIVYSVTDESSFQVAIDLLKTIRANESNNYPIILVGNKSDLVRKKAITREEGRNVALKYTCKFVETSVAINDKVDDLLAGILKQIRLNLGIDNDLLTSTSTTETKKLNNNHKDDNNKLLNLNPIKEILKTAIIEENTTNTNQTKLNNKSKNKKDKKSNKKKHSRNNSTSSDIKNEIKIKNDDENLTIKQQQQQQKKKTNSLLRYKFFSSKRQNSDAENIYNVESNEVPIRHETKRNLSFFHKLFRHVFKRKSTRLLLQSVENLYTPVVKSNDNLAKDS